MIRPIDSSTNTCRLNLTRCLCRSLKLSRVIMVIRYKKLLQWWLFSLMSERIWEEGFVWLVEYSALAGHITDLGNTRYFAALSVSFLSLSYYVAFWGVTFWEPLSILFISSISQVPSKKILYGRWGSSEAPNIRMSDKMRKSRQLLLTAKICLKKTKNPRGDLHVQARGII